MSKLAKKIFVAVVATLISSLLIGFLTNLLTSAKPCSHVWDDGEVKTVATCLQEGELIFECEECGKTKTETLSVTDHIDSDENGECDICGFSLLEEILVTDLSSLDYGRYRVYRGVDLPADCCFVLNCFDETYLIQVDIPKVGVAIDSLDSITDFYGCNVIENNLFELFVFDTYIEFVLKEGSIVLDDCGDQLTFASYSPASLEFFNHEGSLYKIG